MAKKIRTYPAVRGFSLIEVLFTVAILSFALSGLLAMYINLFLSGDINRQMTLATNAALGKIEEIRNTDFDDLPSLNGSGFGIPGFSATDAVGRIEVSNTAYTDLRQARVIVCFRQRGQRIIGEDSNLNAVLDSGEDANADGFLNSPVEAATLIAR